MHTDVCTAVLARSAYIIRTAAQACRGRLAPRTLSTCGRSGGVLIGLGLLRIDCHCSVQKSRTQRSVRPTRLRACGSLSRTYHHGAAGAGRVEAAASGSAPAARLTKAMAHQAAANPVPATMSASAAATPLPGRRGSRCPAARTCRRPKYKRVPCKRGECAMHAYCEALTEQSMIDPNGRLAIIPHRGRCHCRHDDPACVWLLPADACQAFWTTRRADDLRQLVGGQVHCCGPPRSPEQARADRRTKYRTRTARGYSTCAACVWVIAYCVAWYVQTIIGTCCMGKVCSITIVYLHGSEEGIELVRVQLDQPVLTFHGIVRQVGAVCQELCKCTGVIDRTWASIISNPGHQCTRPLDQVGRGRSADGCGSSLTEHHFAFEVVGPMSSGAPFRSVLELWQSQMRQHANSHMVRLASSENLHGPARAHVIDRRSVHK